MFLSRGDYVLEPL